MMSRYALGNPVHQRIVLFVSRVQEGVVEAMNLLVFLHQAHISAIQ